jgi:AcrR family transcriptional regulator
MNDGSTLTRLERRAETRRDEILHAAAKVFRRRGFADAGMREIAAEADLSPGNLYHYFAGKDEILFYCQERAVDRLLAVLDTARGSTNRPARERLHGLMCAHVVCLLDEIGGAVAHLEIESLPPERRASIVDRRDRYERGLRQMISEGIAGGEFEPCDVHVVTRAILGALNWTALWFRPEGAQSASRVAEALADYLIRGLTGNRSRDGESHRLPGHGGRG